VTTLKFLCHLIRLKGRLNDLPGFGLPPSGRMGGMASGGPPPSYEAGPSVRERTSSGAMMASADPQRGAPYDPYSSRGAPRDPRDAPMARDPRDGPPSHHSQ
jgi:hypothetical protein